jgi:uncharacterized protein
MGVARRSSGARPVGTGLGMAVFSLVMAVSACTATQEGAGLPATLSTPTDTGLTNPAEVPSTSPPETERQRARRARVEVRWLRLVMDRFWSREVHDVYGVLFDAPDDLVRFHGDEAVSCGARRIHSPHGAFYCAIEGDEKVAIDVDWLEASYRDHPGDAVAFVVLAHEWGHAVQDTLREHGIGQGVWRPPYRRELNADCLAGSFVGHGIADLTLDADPRTPLVPVWFLLARSGSGELGDPGDHGTAEQRQQAFVVGAQRGTLRCQSMY